MDMEPQESNLNRKPEALYTKARIFGHPIHPALVAFPITFYTACTIGYAAYAGNENPFWFRVAVVANIAGVITAVLAALFGFIDWAFGIPRNHPAKRTGLLHALANSVALILFTINAVLQYRKFDDAVPSVGSSVALSVIALLFTLAAGALGWKLVAQHHVGVQLSEEQRKQEPAIIT